MLILDYKTLKRYEEIVSLRELTVQQGFRANKHGTRTFNLGVDARYEDVTLTIITRFYCFCSVMMVRAQAVFVHMHAQSGTQPEQRTIFHQLARLSQLPISAVFVFDGVERPATKRGKRVLTKAHWLAHDMQALINAFGFYWYTVRYPICFHRNTLTSTNTGTWRS